MAARQDSSTMATNRSDSGTQGQQSTEQGQRQSQGNEGSREDTRMARQDAGLFISPFALLQRFFNDDLTSLFDQLAGGRGRMTPQSRGAGTSMMSWAPKIDVVQRGNELVVRADLPGVNPDDVTVEISEDAIAISGERRQEHTEEQNGIYRVERTFGSFFREIPLPEGAIADQAKAEFKDGVLEITVPAPPEQVSRGRRLEITRGSDTNQNSDARTQGQQSTGNQAAR